jgi:hypothetical protein
LLAGEVSHFFFFANVQPTSLNGRADEDWGDDGYGQQEEAPAVEYEIGEAVDDYIPENNDTLTLVKYDIVYIFKKGNDGWWEGESKGVYGKFPSRYVRILKDGSKSTMADADFAKRQAAFANYTGK